MSTHSLPAAAATSTTFASLLACSQRNAEQELALHQTLRHLCMPLIAAAVLIALWCVWAPLSGAVVASGQVQAALGRKVVQHQEGGIVRELRVVQGQAVKQGDALLVVGDVRSDAQLDLLNKQMRDERLRAARSGAELALAMSFAVPADVAVMPELLAREQQLFDSRRRTLNEQLAAMQSQAHEAQSRIVALNAQLQAAQRSTALTRDELGINAELVASGFMQKTRLLTLERSVADNEARAAATRGQIAEAQMQVGALGNAMAQARGAYQQRAADEHKDAVARVRELEDRLRPSQDQVDRQIVRAPVDGTVMALRIGAAGTVVGPREPLLEIAPSEERLIVELRIDTHDIEHVRVGDAAEVRLSAFDTRRTPLLRATVTAVSPDAVSDTAGKQSWYAAQVEVERSELAANPQLNLQAGMPAEVFVTTPPRSLLQYLLEPLGIFARRALREP